MLGLATSRSKVPTRWVGDDGAEPRVARILSIDADGIIDLDVLPGSVEAHRDLLAPA
jgi:hypothetical protein